MANKEVIDYIRNNLEKGIPLKDIKQSLKNAGWSDKDISDAVVSVFKKETLGIQKKKENVWIRVVIVVIIILSTAACGFFIFFSFLQTCTENWQCTEWSECNNGIQTRTCVDINNCGTITAKPYTMRGCSTSTLSVSKEPKEVFLEYKQKFDNINTSEEYLELIKKYATSHYIEKIEEERSSGSFAGMFNLMKTASIPYSQISNISESIENTTAVLTFTTKDGKTEGRVVMVKENGVWKIDEENYKTVL